MLGERRCLLDGHTVLVPGLDLRCDLVPLPCCNDVPLLVSRDLQRWGYPELVMGLCGVLRWDLAASLGQDLSLGVPTGTHGQRDSRESTGGLLCAALKPL